MRSAWQPTDMMYEPQKNNSGRAGRVPWLLNVRDLKLGACLQETLQDTHIAHAHHVRQHVCRAAPQGLARIAVQAIQIAAVHLTHLARKVPLLHMR